MFFRKTATWKTQLRSAETSKNGYLHDTRSAETTWAHTRFAIPRTAAKDKIKLCSQAKKEHHTTRVYKRIPSICVCAQSTINSTTSMFETTPSHRTKDDCQGLEAIERTNGSHSSSTRWEHTPDKCMMSSNSTGNEERKKWGGIMENESTL